MYIVCIIVYYTTSIVVVSLIASIFRSEAECELRLASSYFALLGGSSSKRQSTFEKQSDFQEELTGRSVPDPWACSALHSCSECRMNSSNLATDNCSAVIVAGCVD